jgi:hypothetical protein
MDQMQFEFSPKVLPLRKRSHCMAEYICSCVRTATTGNPALTHSTAGVLMYVPYLHYPCQEELHHVNDHAADKEWRRWRE